MNNGRPSFLGDFAEIVMGQAPPGRDCNKEGQGTVFVKAGEFTERRPVVREWTTKPLRVARSGDVLVCVVGATAGKINEAIDCAIGRSVAAVRPESSKLHSGYLYHFLTTQVLPLRAKSQGLAQSVITREMLQELPIPVPSLAAQRRIAAILDKADGLRAKRRVALARIDGLIEAIFLDLFGDPAANPKGWPKVSIGSVADIIVPTRDKPKRFAGDIPWITLPDVDGLFVSRAKHSLTTEDADEVGNRLIPSNSVLLSCAATLGTVVINTVPVYANQQFYGLVPGKQIEATFLAASLRAKGEQFFARLGGSFTIGFFSKQKALDIQIPLPGLQLQSEYKRRLTAVQNLRNTEQGSLKEMDALFASLQHRAFRGEL